MLKFLQIDNFAIIKNTQIDFENGLNVISGETGSGKSIIMKAIKFVLGARGDKSLIRDGENKTKVQATFFGCNEDVINILNEFDIEYDDTLIISRTMHLDGKNDIKINGNSVTLSMLSKLCEGMVDIYSQQEHFSLLDVKKHIGIIDAFDVTNTDNIKSELDTIYNKIIDIDKKLNECFADENAKYIETELLKHQIEEIEGNIFSSEEEQNLINKKNYFANYKKIYNAMHGASMVLSQGYNGYALSAAVKEAINSLMQVRGLDKQFEDIADRLESVLYEMQDIESVVEENLNLNSISEEEVDQIEERLEQIKMLKRKYGDTLEDIMLSLHKAKDRLNFIENNEQVVKELEKEKEMLLEKGKQKSEQLSTLRKNIAKAFEGDLTAVLADLGMKNCKFVVQFSTIQNQLGFTKHGFDNVEFLFSANKGQDVKPLAKIISGGELSRFMLAYKNVAHKQDKKDVLIFDEVDAGISGDVGQKIAFKLHNISLHAQVISISHLPQIISMADINFVVKKQVIDNCTQSVIALIENQELEHEIARVCGNGQITDVNIALAKELIQYSKNYKDKI